MTATRELRLWACGCSHVHSDLRHGRRSLGEAIEQSERGGSEGGPAFEWDIMLNLGDLSGTQAPPRDEDGPPVVEQLGAGRRHGREDIYCLAGNHDASGPSEPTQWWFRKWIDPTGESPQFSGVRNEKRRYPVVGTWERYAISIGNVLILMMSDRNDGGPPRGRGEKGGYPAGAITRETFEWWRHHVERHRDRIIITCAHHMLRDTTTATGRWEGVNGNYHGRYEDAEGASYLYWVGDDADSNAFHDYLEAHPGAIDFWIGSHTHAHPDDRFGRKSMTEQRWGVTFVNTGALTRHHGHKERNWWPSSRLITLREGSCKATLQTYLHTSHYAPQGWYAPSDRSVTMKRAFEPVAAGSVQDDGGKPLPHPAPVAS